ncbi:unnamed protein product [Closterium sp. NIES-53]
MHNGASRANRLRASASVRTAVFYGATLDNRSAAALAHCRPAVLACRHSVVLAWLLYATLAGCRPCCAAMIALCQEHRLEHRTKHIALRYFLARELQQRSQLRLAYVATRANTADIFTKAVPSGDHQRFSTVLGLWTSDSLAYATRVVAAPPPYPLSVGGESALGCDVLEDKQFELEFLATASPSLYAILVKQLPGSPPVFKARYVARGFSQREGVDFFQTFAPTLKMTTLQVLLHVAAQRDYELHSLDFSTALRRPVYGLRRSPREWHDTLRSTLRDLGFRPSSADPSLLVRAGFTPFFILVYVDDLVFAIADRGALAEVKSELQKRHTCTDLDELQRYLGLQITRDRAARTITLSKSHMVQHVLWRFEF